MDRRFAIGLTIGSIWLIVASIGFSGGTLGLAGGAYAKFGLPAVLIAGGILICAGIVVLRQTLSLPKVAAPARGVKRPFLLVLLAEIAGWNIANAACVIFWTWRAIAAVDLIIVGLHFLPLAGVFKVPRYRILGVLFCVVSIGTLTCVPREAQTGNVASWIALPTFGCSAIASVFGLIGIVQAWRLAQLSAFDLTEPPRHEQVGR